MATFRCPLREAMPFELHEGRVAAAATLGKQLLSGRNDEVGALLEKKEEKNL